MQRKLIKPSRPTSSFTRCTLAENILFSSNTYSFMFFYREQLDRTRLVRSLELVLNDYPAYAGRLRQRRGDFRVEHGTYGVQLEFVESEKSLAALSAGPMVKEDTTLCPKLSLIRAQLGRGPLFAARFTSTVDGGTVFGMTCHHLLGDVTSTMNFLRAWTQAYQGLPYQTPIEVQDLESYQRERIPVHAANDGGASALPWRDFLRRVVYVLSHPVEYVELPLELSTTEELYSILRKTHRVSRHDVLCGQVFSMVGELAGAPHDLRLMLVTCLRRRFELPANLPGNFTDFVLVDLRSDDDASTVAVKLRAGINAFKGGPMSYHHLAQRKDQLISSLQRIRYSVGVFKVPGGLYLTTTFGAGLSDLAFERERPVRVGMGRFSIRVPWMGVTFESTDKATATVCLWLPSKVARAVVARARRSA